MDEKAIFELSTQLGEKLRARSAWITSAESCTGGMVAQMITSVPGSSAWFDRSFVTYSNSAKHDLLGVAEATLSAYGAVSEETVREMATGALHAAHADLAIAISGIAGPDGGSEEKPVGTVWFGFADSNGRVTAVKRIFSGDRQAVRSQAAVFALQTALTEFLEK